MENHPMMDDASVAVVVVVVAVAATIFVLVYPILKFHDSVDCLWPMIDFRQQLLVNYDEMIYQTLHVMMLNQMMMIMTCYFHHQS